MDPFLDTSALEEVMAHGPRLSRGDDRTGASRSGTALTLSSIAIAAPRNHPRRAEIFKLLLAFLFWAALGALVRLRRPRGALRPDPRGASSPRSPVP